MNNVFDISRFGKVLCRNLAEHRMKFVWIALTAIGLLALTVITNRTIDTGLMLDTWEVLASALVVLSPLLFFRNRNRISSVFDFTYPASSFEKYLSKWVLCVVCVPLLTVAILLAVWGVYALLPAGNEWGVLVSPGELMGEVVADYLRWNELVALLSVQSFFWLGTFYFRSYVLPKVCLALLLYAITLAVLVTALIAGFTYFDYGGFEYWGDAHYNNVTWVGTSEHWSPQIVMLAMWLVGFLKFRETEV